MKMQEKPSIPPYSYQFTSAPPYQHPSAPPYQHPSAPPYEQQQESAAPSFQVSEPSCVRGSPLLFSHQQVPNPPAFQGSEPSYVHGSQLPYLQPQVSAHPYLNQQGSAAPFIHGSEPSHVHGSAPSLTPVSASTKVSTQPIPERKHKKCLKSPCCIIIGIVVVLMLVLFFALFLFKKRPVEVTTNNVSLEKLSNSIQPLTLDLVLGVDITIKNPNFAGFNYKSSEMKFFYHGVQSGRSPITAGAIKARSTKSLHNTVYMDPGAMMSTPFLLPEMVAGQIMLSSSMTLMGNCVVFNVIKIQATIATSCDITVNLQTRTNNADCKVDVKLS